MGTFSIWHWIIVLVFIGVPVTAIAFANGHKTLSRLPYFWRTLGVWAANLGLWFVADGLPDTASDQTMAATILVFCIVALILGVLETLWSVHRIQEIGGSKWWSLLLWVPAVNLIYIAFLIFYPGQATVEPSGEDAAMV